VTSSEAMEQRLSVVGLLICSNLPLSGSGMALTAQYNPLNNKADLQHEVIGTGCLPLCVSSGRKTENAEHDEAVDEDLEQ
jgi:hypothetical protein